MMETESQEHHAETVPEAEAREAEAEEEEAAALGDLEPASEVAEATVAEVAMVTTEDKEEPVAEATTMRAEEEAADLTVPEEVEMAEEATVTEEPEETEIDQQEAAEVAKEETVRARDVKALSSMETDQEEVEPQEAVAKALVEPEALDEVVTEEKAKTEPLTS